MRPKAAGRAASSRHAFGVIGREIAVAWLLLVSAPFRASRKLCVAVGSGVVAPSLDANLSVPGRLFAKPDAAFRAVA